MKSDYAIIADEAQKKLKPWLKSLGFHMRGRTFNRSTPDGLTQVINMQMGASDPPGTTYPLPWLCENFHGKVTINLGVFVPEVAQYTLHLDHKKKDFMQEYDCCVRERLGCVGPEKKDLWWELKQSDMLAKELQVRIERDALPFLERFASRDAILREWHGKIENMGTTPPRIVCAIILSMRGRREEARKLLTLQAQETLNPGHPAYVRSLAERLGIPLAG